MFREPVRGGTQVVMGRMRLLVRALDPVPLKLQLIHAPRVSKH
jgi:hypothetical protein